jgi:uncharacterized damage-inducible protein DinB
MKTFFKELLQYNNHFNQEIISVLIQNPEKASEKCIRVISHILNAHQTWNYRIQPGKVAYEAWEIHKIQALCEIDQNNFELSTLLLDKFELSQTIHYLTRKGKAFTNTVQDILFQVINHSTYHRGQIATEFRQSGLEPLLTDYIFYKWA